MEDRDFSGFGGLEEFRIATAHQEKVQDFLNGYVDLLYEKWGRPAVEKMIKEVKYLRDSGGMELGEALSYHYFNITKKELYA